MRKLAAPVALLLLVVAPLPAQAPPAPPATKKATPPLKVPASVPANGSLVFVKAETNSAWVLWYALDPGFTVFPPDLLKDSKTGVFIPDRALAAGNYRVMCLVGNADGGDTAVCTLVVGTPPTPPNPPGPPTPPGPSDPLAVVMQAAYTQETSPTKAADVAKMAAVFAAESGMALTFTTVKALHDDLKKQLKKQLAVTSAGTLPKVEGVIKAELLQAFGTDGAAALDRVKASAELARIANALKGVK